MNRRDFLARGVGCSIGAQIPAQTPVKRTEGSLDERVRALFPRLQHDVFLNAAGGTPLATFAEAGLRRVEDFWRLGRGSGRWARVQAALTDTRTRFARLIGAQSSEIAFVHWTKAGEQIVLDGLPGLRKGGNVVTNDLHFSGSLHNLVGLRKSGVDVRIVRGDRLDVSLEAMEAAIDKRTALVSVTLVSNVNGRIEPLPKLAEIAHARGALVYADIIQAAGIVPMDVKALGVDFAACSGYKWLYGPHGTGFLDVRKELQGKALPDRSFPGHAGHNYAPWIETPDPEHSDYVYHPPADARRYQPGHIGYLGYCALQAGLEFIDRIGVDAACKHSVRLAQRLQQGLDPKRYRCLSPHLDRAPIVAFQVADAPKLVERLQAAKLVIAVGRDSLRVSPAPYNNNGDIDLLAKVLNRAG